MKGSKRGLIVIDKSIITIVRDCEVFMCCVRKWRERERACALAHEDIIINVSLVLFRYYVRVEILFGIVRNLIGTQGVSC